MLEQEQIDTIIHAAAQTHVDNSFGNRSLTENNVMGTHVLVETAKSCGIKRFIHVSTDEVYGSSYDDDPSRREGDVLEPTNPYAATKAAENIVKSYWSSFKLPVIITRGNNVYGPHQYPEKVIPKFIRRLVNGEPCCIHGDGSNSRHYIYVGDVVSAFDTVLHKGVPGETYNIGCHEEITNLQLAERLVREIYPRARTRARRSTSSRTARSTTCATTSTTRSCSASTGSPSSRSRKGCARRSSGTRRSTPSVDVGTDSSLAPHPTPAEVVSASASAAK